MSLDHMGYCSFPQRQKSDLYIQDDLWHKLIAVIFLIAYFAWCLFYFQMNASFVSTFFFGTN